MSNALNGADARMDAKEEEIKKELKRKRDAVTDEWSADALRDAEEEEAKRQRKRRRDEEMDEWLGRTQMKVDEETHQRNMQMAKLRYPWHEILDAYVNPDPANIVMDYMIWDVCSINEPCYYPEIKLPILLLFYGDHNTRVFLHFMDHIIADGDTKPLAKVLMDPVKKKYPKFELKHFLVAEDTGEYQLDDDESGDDEIFDTFEHAHDLFVRGAKKSNHEVRYASPEAGRHLMVKFRLCGQDYIACETMGRQDYRIVHKRVCGTNHDGYTVDAAWRCKHSVVINFHMRSVATLLNPDFPLDKIAWETVRLLYPSCWMDVLYGMQLKRGPECLWWALLDGFY